MTDQMKSLKLFTVLSAGCLAAGSASAQSFNVNTGSAQAYAGSIDQGATALSAASSFASASLSSGPGLKAGYRYDTYESDAIGAERAFDSDLTQHSASLAYVHVFESLAAGLALSFVDSETEGDYSDGGNVGEVDIEGDGWVVSAGASHSWGAFNATIAGGIGSLSQDSTRESAFGQSDADFDSDLTFVSIELNYGFEVSETFELSPFARLNYQDVNVDSFSEDSSALDSGNIDSIDRDWITGELGLFAGFELSDNLSATASLSVLHDFESDEIELSGQDSGALAGRSRVEVETVGETLVKGSLGLAYMFDEAWTLTAGLDLASGDDVDTFGARVGLSRKF